MQDNLVLRPVQLLEQAAVYGEEADLKLFKMTFLSSLSQVKQHIETHITTIVHQCALCPKILKTRNALRAHMNQKHDSKPRQTIVESPPWMGGGGGNGDGGQSGNFANPVQVRQVCI